MLWFPHDIFHHRKVSSWQGLELKLISSSNWVVTYYSFNNIVIYNCQRALFITIKYRNTNYKYVLKSFTIVNQLKIMLPNYINTIELWCTRGDFHNLTPSNWTTHLRSICHRQTAKFRFSTYKPAIPIAGQHDSCYWQRSITLTAVTTIFGPYWTCKVKL